MKPEEIIIYNGNYDYYKEHSVIEPEAISVVKEKSDSAKAYDESRKNKAEDRKRRAKLMNTEKEMTALQTEINNLKELCNDPDISSNYARLSELLEEIKTKEEALEELETLWLKLA